MPGTTPGDPPAYLKTSFLTAPCGPLLPWRRFQFPLEWAAQFPHHDPFSPLHLEVGFGDGRYTVRRALEEPGSRFVGLEISSASLQRGLKRVRRAGVSNVKLLKVGAAFAVRHLFPPGSLTSITVNFPDPWPKERHERRRLLQASFFRLAAARLARRGAILLATDHPEYLAFAQREAAASGVFVLEEAEAPPAVFETKYALKWKEQGKRLFYQVFRFTGAAVPEVPGLTREETMPHALLTGVLPPAVTFHKRVTPYGDGHVILHEVARSLGSDGPEHGEKWLVRATVDEPELRQQVLVSVRTRPSGGLIVGLEPFGDPIVTETARGAVHAVTEWLLSLGGVRVEIRAY
jgi:tRNA (guanine-N7-)-methyltransferase